MNIWAESKIEDARLADLTFGGVRYFRAAEDVDDSYVESGNLAATLDAGPVIIEEEDTFFRLNAVSVDAPAEPVTAQRLREIRDGNAPGLVFVEEHVANPRNSDPVKYAGGTYEVVVVVPDGTGIQDSQEDMA